MQGGCVVDVGSVPASVWRFVFACTTSENLTVAFESGIIVYCSNEIRFAMFLAKKIVIFKELKR